MKLAVKTNNLSKRYNGNDCVSNVDLKIPEGSIYGFLGPNGAGKSTTMKMLLGLVKPSGGSVEVLGHTMNDKNRLAILQETGSLIESPSYYSHLTGRENLEIVCLLKGVPEKEIDNVLHIVRMEKQQNKKAGHYSLGMKQRLGLAAALLGRPRLLLLDEPTNGLDPAGIQEMRELICSLPEKYGMTVMVSSHLLSEIDQMATTCGIINHGELIFQGSLKSLHAYSSASIAFKTSNPVGTEALLHRMKPQIEDDTVLVHDIDDKMTAQINRLLIENGIDVYRIEEHALSLEDIFLKLTGKGGAL